MYAKSIYRLKMEGHMDFEHETEHECILEAYSRIDHARQLGCDVDPTFIIEHIPGEWVDPTKEI